MTDDTQDLQPGTQAWSQTVLDTVRTYRARAAEHYSTVRVLEVEVRQALHELRGIAVDRDVLPILLERVDDPRPEGRT